MKKRSILSIGLAVLMLFSFVACSGKEEAQLEELNLTYVKAPLNVPSILEKNDGILEEHFGEDVKINWHELTSGPEQTQALAAGDLQILHALGGTSAILAGSSGVDLKIIGVYSRAPKAFMIISNDPSIKTPADLEGKKVAGPKGTVLHQLLAGSLRQEDLSLDDIEFLSMGIPEAFAALTTNSVDAALLAGPMALKAINAGGNVVTNGEGIVDGTIVTAVSRDFLEKHPEAVEKFVEAHKETLVYMKENEEDALLKVAEEVGLTLEETREMFEWYDFDWEITEKDIEELKKTQEFMLENVGQEKEIVIEDLIK